MGRIKFTVSVCVLCVLFFALEADGATDYNVLLGTGSRLSPLLALGVVFQPLVSEGQWWRLVTAGFLHFGILHLVLNLFAFVYVGFYLEPRYGTRRFAIIYFTAMIAGNFLAYAT